jgi:hypothetical protein
MSALVAVVAAIGAALMLGVSSVADQRSTKRVESRRALSPRIVLDLARQPLWVIAIATNLAGFAVQVVALSFGSIALVQPVLVCDLIFAVLILSFVRRRSELLRPGGRREALIIFAGVAAATLGVAGFLVIGRPSAGTTNVSFGIFPPLAIGLIVVVGGCLAAAARKRALRPLALAVACGVCYGVAAFVLKLLTSEFGGGLARVLSNWPVYVLAVAGAAGYVLMQDAFQQGTFLAPVQAILTAADPVISITLGIAWLNVRLRTSPADVAGEIVSILLMITGIVTVARYSPAAARAASTSSPPGPPANRPAPRARVPAGETGHPEPGRGR